LAKRESFWLILFHDNNCKTLLIPDKIPLLAQYFKKTYIGTLLVFWPYFDILDTWRNLDMSKITCINMTEGHLESSKKMTQNSSVKNDIWPFDLIFELDLCYVPKVMWWWVRDLSWSRIDGRTDRQKKSYHKAAYGTL
jgi:hypothetical protein